MNTSRETIADTGARSDSAWQDRRRGLAALCCALTGLCAATAKADPPLNISYNLTTSQRVSINIYNASGALVRELIHGSARTAGARTELWDGRDDTGAAVPAGSYSWKMLATPGFSTEYLGNPGSDYPVTVASPNTSFASQGLGSHGGPNAVTVNSSGVIMAAGGTEGIEPGLIVLSLDGATRLGTGGGPGSTALAMGGTTFWDCRNDGKVYGSPGGTATSFSSSFNNEGTKDMAADATNVILCYSTQGLVRWLSNAGIQTRSVSVPGAKAVDVAPDGTVYVISGTTMQKIPVGATAPQAFISTGLSAPRRAAVNPTNGDIYIVDCPPYGGGQIKRYSSAGALLQTYGAAGGRADGLYVKTNFKGSTDIAVESNGNFWVAEGESAPRRVARFNVSGAFLNESVGGQVWGPWIVPEPDNPNFVWMASTYGDMMRCQLNFSTKSWTVHSVYTYNGLANGLFTNQANATLWEARVKGGQLYLCRMGAGPQVLRVDRTNWKLMPSAVGVESFFHPKVAWAQSMATAGGYKAMLWTDANGDGKPLNADNSPQTNEMQWFTAEGVSSVGIGSSIEDGGANCLNHLYVSAGKIRRYNVTSWNGTGSPVFGDFPAGVLVGDMPPRPLGNSSYSGTNFATDTQGNIWSGFNPNASWGSSTDSFFARWNSNGTLAWMSGRRGYKPGNLMTLRHIFGTVNVGTNYNAVVASKFDNEWPADGVAPLYVYDQDGLYAGLLMGKPAGTVQPSWRYGLGAEALAGVIMKDSGGNVYLYAHWINEGRVYKISGWNGWQRSSGSVTVPTGYVAPGSLLEVTGPSGAGTGLKGEYFKNLDLSGQPSVTRIDPVLDMTGAEIYNGGYNIRWTGAILARRTGWHMFDQTRHGGSPNAAWVNGINVQPTDLNAIGFPTTRFFQAGRAVWLEAGKFYPVRVDHTNNFPGQTPGVQFVWAEPETNGQFTVVPGSQLFPAIPITQTDTASTTSQTAFAASAVDLINTGQSTYLSRVDSGYASYGGSSTAKLNDGSSGVASDVTTTAFDLDGVWTTTFNLNTSTNTLGYDLNLVESLSGWTDQRVNQQFSLAYTTVANPTPVSLGTFSYAPGSQGTNGATKLSLARTWSSLASGVKSLIFGFQSPAAGAETVYREIDAFGVPTAAGTGLRGQYFSGSAFNTLLTTRTDPTINFDWAAGGPSGTSTGNDNFSIRWMGLLRPSFSETYTFTLTADSGARLWVNNQLLIDKPAETGVWTGNIALTAGEKVDIRVDYNETSGDAYAILEWESPSQPLQVVPQNALYPCP